VRYANPIATLAPWPVVRTTHNPVEAVTWGIAETRDLILQGYLTLQRVFGGSVPASNMSGPVGIFQAGTAFAKRGPDWFVWFLAVISANLAVVNFLPVPILDGWHFLGLIKEKLTGKPLSEGVQVVAQYVGLAMILSLILFVTFNDITRLLR
jgi:regulator of sigma E protease